MNIVFFYIYIYIYIYRLMNIVKCCLIGENVLRKKNVNRISELCYVILCGFGLGALKKKKKKKNYSGFVVQI
jgi:hypothetical protein